MAFNPWEQRRREDPLRAQALALDVGSNGMEYERVSVFRDLLAGLCVSTAIR